MRTDISNENFAICFRTRIMETELNKEEKVVKTEKNLFYYCSDLLCIIIIIIIIIIINRSNSNTSSSVSQFFKESLTLLHCAIINLVRHSAHIGILKCTYIISNILYITCRYVYTIYLLTKSDIPVPNHPLSS